MTPKPDASMLKLNTISAQYGCVGVLHDISIAVGSGELVSILGANGAGKTTLFRVVSGLLRPTAGRVLFAGWDITDMAPHRRARSGIGQVPEGRGLFRALSVLDNLRLPIRYGSDAARETRPESDLLETAFALFPVLRERQRQAAGTLSGGEQQMLATARALLMRPKLLLLDEPSLGLAPLLVAEIFKVIRRLNDAGMAILLVEQNAYAALHISHRAYIIEHGRIAAAGTADQILHDEKVRQLYLGKGTAVGSDAGLSANTT